MLEEKYDFLDEYMNELVLDTIIQDKLLSLDNYELYILKNIVNLSSNYACFLFDENTTHPPASAATAISATIGRETPAF